jgi:uncharacterized protein with HEPN domain
MRRDLLLLEQMIEAADQAVALVEGVGIVHDYWSIDLDIVHTTAREQLPGFAADLRRVLAAIT